MPLARKLSDEQARGALFLLERGESQAVIAARLNVTQTVISQLKRGITYRDVTSVPRQLPRGARAWPTAARAALRQIAEHRRVCGVDQEPRCAQLLIEIARAALGEAPE